jgi:hypothetical protein
MNTRFMSLFRTCSIRHSCGRPPRAAGHHGLGGLDRAAQRQHDPDGAARHLDAEAMAMPAELVEGPPDPGALLERFEPRGEPFILAARVTGPFRTAFPDGPPEGVEEAQPHLDEPRASLNLILIGDSDVLASGAGSAQGCRATYTHCIIIRHHVQSRPAPLKVVRVPSRAFSLGLEEGACQYSRA